jgi:tRNA threonylcarbamoyladenosine biosynthesis protein TsaE
VLSLVTRNEEETAALGKRLGHLLLPGDFIALMGELGSGKTRFVQGVATGLQVGPDLPVTSPTYSILHIHSGRLPMFHFDLYRLKGAEDVEELGFEEYFYGEGVCLVEWADRLHGEMPAERLIITFSHLGKDERRIDFAPAGSRYEGLVMSIHP